MSAIVRYVDDDGMVIESLLALVHVAETTGRYLFDKLQEIITSLGLSFDFLVGQYYDGASNMSGAYNGLQALIKHAAKLKPVYIHCWAHTLNLILQDTAKSTLLCSRTFELLQKIYVFMEGSPQRHGEYLKSLEALQLDDGMLALQTLSGTRWSAKCVNLRIVKRCLPAIFRSLEEMSDSDASGLLTAVKDPCFVFGLEFLTRLFLLVNAASEALQSIDMDLAAAGESIAALKQSLINMDNDYEFNSLFTAAVSRCDQLDINWQQRAVKRPRKPPASLTSFVMDRFLTSATDGASVQNLGPEEELKCQLKVDFFSDRFLTQYGVRWTRALTMTVLIF